MLVWARANIHVIMPISCPVKSTDNCFYSPAPPPPTPCFCQPCHLANDIHNRNSSLSLFWHWVLRPREMGRRKNVFLFNSSLSRIRFVLDVVRWWVTRVKRSTDVLPTNIYDRKVVGSNLRFMMIKGSSVMEIRIGILHLSCFYLKDWWINRGLENKTK